MSELGLLSYPVTITNDYQRDQLLERMKLIQSSSAQPILIRITDKKQKRSEAINALSHRWYGDCAKQGSEHTESGIKAIAKLKWGVPIMRKHESFNASWLKLTQGFPTYEEQIELMALLPVTSLMTNAEMSQYMNHFKAVMGTHYDLTDPRLQGIEL
jgi:hypothetical protein